MRATSRRPSRPSSKGIELALFSFTPTRFSPEAASKSLHWQRGIGFPRCMRFVSSLRPAA
jgi:hypothetical protein